MALPPIDVIPGPVPHSSRPQTFASEMDAWIAAQQPIPAQINAFGAAVESLGNDVEVKRAEVAQSAVQVAEDRVAAQTAASTAVNAPGSGATSTTNLTIGTGPKALTVQAGKLFAAGQQVVVASSASPLNWMAGTITAYDSGTGALTVSATNVNGGGTFAAWTISLAGVPGVTGLLNELLAAPVASAATIDLSAATGNLVHVTGTTAITAITLPAGAERTVIFDGALTLTHGAALLLPGAVNILTAANDRMIVRGDTAGVIVVSYTKASGVAVKNALTLLATLTPTAAANVDLLNIFTADYDNYMIICTGIRPSATGTLLVRLANAGVVDLGSKYFGANVGATGNTAGTSVTTGLTVESAGIGASIHLHVMNTKDAVNGKTIRSSLTSNYSGGAQYLAVDSWGIYNSANGVSGLRLFWSNAANFQAGGSIRVYGYSNS